MSAQPLTRMTAEEYLAAERAAEFRSECYDGCVYAMAAASFPHTIIAGNLFHQLKMALGKRKCFVTLADW
jgi:Uma2 family endonuclease